ncbi:Oidioi.mRNA.OKI2018_I69.PAR.g9921.t1.cds [Oikopleura dioica]|uniref:Oidioi.mRNA.OKI2018_I69.PAR.g9921.t1.cds n=1 Tax=Oikopleura dioica TaxID=34765 RepID=A0ABN7RT93_OIKDI|nr:Oidioi.mRNA.OKI2018_I69.PAR.g9921.t1.cds [Oikopleura dioica]
MKLNLFFFLLFAVGSAFWRRREFRPYPSQLRSYRSRVRERMIDDYKNRRYRGRYYSSLYRFLSQEDEEKSLLNRIPRFENSKIVESKKIESKKVEKKKENN